MRQFSVFLIILFIAAGTQVYATTQLSPLQIGSFKLFHQNSKDLVKEPSKTLAFVGDVMLARRVETYLETYGSDYVYSQLPTVPSNTILVGNFEGSITKQHVHTPDNTFNFSINEKHVPALKKYGFTHLNLANNHSLDFGPTDLLSTQKTLDENSLEWFGNPDALASTSVTYIKSGSKVVAMIGINTIGYNFDKIVYRNFIDEVLKHSDIQVVYIHWGTEYMVQHSSKQEALAHFLADSGIDVIVGHHPHVVQDIEQYKNTLIFYSLGNFIFDQYFSEEVQKGLWLELELTKTKLQINLQGVTSINSLSAPQFMSKEENQIFISEILQRSNLDIQDNFITGSFELKIDMYE